MRCSATLGTDYQATGKLQRWICLTKMECRLNDPRSSILLWFQVKKKNHKLVGGTRGERASLVAQSIKNPPAMRETWVGSLSQEDPLEEGMATHSSILAWKIPRREEPGRLMSMESQKVGHDWATNILSFYKFESKGPQGRGSGGGSERYADKVD